MWAVERYVGHWDGYAGTAAPFRPNNYYLHSLDDGVFAMLPWGTDQTSERVREVEFDEPAGGLLFNSCLDDISCEALYEEGLLGVANEVPNSISIRWRSVHCRTARLPGKPGRFVAAEYDGAETRSASMRRAVPSPNAPRNRQLSRCTPDPARPRSISAG